ncbi:MAG TPA: DUF2862 domain-containing protein, partial [Stenomitos sp.]
TLINCGLVIFLESLVEMEVGQKVRVCRIRDRVAGDVGQKLGQVGTIKGYKMTDGSGVGVVVTFEDRYQTWFFEDELEPVQ